MRKADFHGSKPVRWGRHAFTVIELLVVVSIIAVLVALLIPAVSVLRNSSRATASRNTVMGLNIALKSYQSEDERHFYPNPAAGDLLIYDQVSPDDNLTQLEARGYDLRRDSLDQDPASPTFRAMLDAWKRPIYYRLDGPFRIAGLNDATRVNGTADRPADPIPLDWNPQGVEPWAYVWSLGRPKADLATDAQTANVQNWIYQQGVP